MNALKLKSSLTYLCKLLGVRANVRIALLGQNMSQDSAINAGSACLSSIPWLILS